MVVVVMGVTVLDELVRVTVDDVLPEFVMVLVRVTVDDVLPGFVMVLVTVDDVLPGVNAAVVVEEALVRFLK